MRVALKKWTAPKGVPEFITALPGEIRNQIFEYCISEAINSPKAKRSRPRTSIPKSMPSFTISALPLWSGPSSIRMNGIGPLPLLFVNRQIYEEVSSFLYSMVDELCMGGLMLQYRGEDPNIRWNGIYPLLENRVNLHKFIKNVKISLPSPREDLTGGHWRSLGFIKPPAPVPGTANHKPWAIVPGLVKYLSTFSELSKLEIIITNDTPEPPDFEDLLPLWDLCGAKTVLSIKSPNHPGFLSWPSSSQTDWEIAWECCLISHGRLAKFKHFSVVS